MGGVKCLMGFAPFAMSKTVNKERKQFVK